MIERFIKKIKPQKNEVSYFDELVKTDNVQGMMNAISKLPNPDIILRKTGKSIDTLSELTNHYQVGTCIDSRKSGTTKKLWSLERLETSSKNLDFYKEIFKNLDVYQLIEDILDAPLYGFNVIEINWKADGKYIVPEKCEAKPLKWFHYNSEGDLFFKHKDYTEGLIIKPEQNKFLVPRHKPTVLNPYGQAILSRCFWNVAFINGGMEFWIKFTEKYGMPFMIGKYDQSMNKDEKENLLKALVNMVQDAVGVIPNDGAVEILEANRGSSADIYDKLITRCENNISKSILGQTLTTDIGKSGSYAAAATHNQVRQDLINSDIRLVEKTFNQLIKYINNINFGEEETPYFCLYEDDDVDQDIANRDAKIYNTGVRFTKKYYIKTYGFSEDDIDIIADEPINESEFADTETNIFDEMENLTEIFNSDDISKIIDPVLKPIIELFEQTRDAEECTEKLAEVYPDFNTAELEKVLTKVIFLGELLGRIKDE